MKSMGDDTVCLISVSRLAARLCYHGHEVPKRLKKRKRVSIVGETQEKVKLAHARKTRENHDLLVPACVISQLRVESSGENVPLSNCNENLEAAIVLLTR
jgi:FlaA1/EpsC-like NDP-sugar epimerase